MTRRTGHSITHVAVVVPAADEEATIGACLTAVTAAVNLAQRRDRQLSCRVVVVLDRCADGTAAALDAWPQVDAVRSAAGNLGAARDQGSRWALRNSPVGRRHTWTAHTDADSVVPAHWLTDQLTHAALGAALVLGTVRPVLEGAQLAAWTARHQLQDGHPYVHGANLGIRADVLDDVGGWRHQAEHEDSDLVARVVAGGHPIARVAGAPVLTSARLVGRTPGGMAAYLRDLAGGDACDAVLPAPG